MDKSHPPPRLSAILVNFASWKETARLTRQMLAGGVVRRGVGEVVIVDNHSPPHPLMGRLRRRRSVSVRRWARNRGFGRAVNEGVRLSRGEWVLLLNPDTSVPPGFLDRVLTVADQASSEIGIIGFRLLNSDGSPQPSVGRFPTFTSTLVGRLRARSRRKYLPEQPSVRCQVDWLSGCCLLIRRECFTQLGGFDPAFFLYYEDVDLCRRARQQGWSVVFDPGIAVCHHRPLQGRRIAPHVRLFTRHALLTYAARNWPAWQARLLALLVGVEALGHRLAAWWRGPRREEKTLAEMASLAWELFHGRADQARARLHRVARQEERRAARAVRRRAQSQPSRPAEGVPEQRDPVRAAGDRDHRR